MFQEILGIIAIFLLAVVLAIPLGKYIVKVFKNEKTWSDFIAPLEGFIFRISTIDPTEPMDWKQNMKAMLVLNGVFFVWAMLLLLTQGIHPFWNPDNIAAMEPTQAFNTAVSFTTNTNLQHYSGEASASYLTQLLVFCFLQFVSAGTGIAALALLFQGLLLKQSTTLGNFYNLFLKSCTRILLPISVVIAIILLTNGMPATFKGAEQVITLQGDTVSIARGPVAPMVTIKQLGTNGGGYFGSNSTHPFENPNYLTNMVENFAIILIPIALVFAFGFYIHRPRLGYAFFCVMTLLFLLFVGISVSQEMGGNPMLAKMGIDITAGNMEGKEVRFGTAASSMWGVSTTSTSNGSVNSMHDSHMPLSGGVFILDMMINAIYGGVGVGLINFFVFVVIGVFISGLMVGRTPELLGKKIEAKEIKIAALIAILHPMLILVGTALSSHLAAGNGGEVGYGGSAQWLNNPSFHGFSEMLYEFTSSSANNGSGFEGLGDNTPFWNIACGVVMLMGRFLPIIGPLAIIGSLAAKKSVPQSAGTLQLDSYAFSAVLLSVIIIIAALSFFPALALGPLAEYFMI
ncbi:potassium-transporting ATPase subunit KdpA [Rhodocytophaga aerolata]|uniref:Potassium-transporting ATPase potassium-binding subunit n=1 Tax=Rhodocytophaga aerolata TaxID=455078 RepID=A0ABT8RIB8_9BACT|nr:potassium-transporting ATPase subunit KdpA [Rhodocytophaga aerolata]MDO1451466.1 potassium-transporting ATPase subunit KdpA [Rhodocytophaga aerolata]